MSTSISSCTDLLWQWISCTITNSRSFRVQPCSSNCAINARKKNYSESSRRISRGERRHTQSSRARDREREREETREEEGRKEGNRRSLLPSLINTNPVIN
jgi:hypothetical protein